MPERKLFRALIAAVIIALTARSTRAELATVDSAASYPEGPLWWQGELLYVEYAASAIKSWDGQHLAIRWSEPGCGPSALIGFAGRHLLVACYDANALVELDEHAKQVRRITRDRDGKPFAGPNDFAADRSGGIYFTASGSYDVKAPITGAVLHLSADGNTVRSLAGMIHYSNGLAVSSNGKTLLVAEMLAQRILSFPINQDGSLGVRSVWARLQDLAPRTAHEDAYNGPDGLKLGPDGNYYIAQNGSGRVLVVGEDRKLVRLIEVPTPYVTNMAFGGPGTGSVYITGAFDQWKPPFPGGVYRWSP
jgi:gluconolactonase